MTMAPRRKGEYYMSIIIIHQLPLFFHPHNTVPPFHPQGTVKSCH